MGNALYYSRCDFYTRIIYEGDFVEIKQKTKEGVLELKDLGQCISL